jgi:hypothetical protein
MTVAFVLEWRVGFYLSSWSIGNLQLLNCQAQKESGLLWPDLSVRGCVGMNSRYIVA